jgi:hypothetical protein
MSRPLVAPVILLVGILAACGDARPIVGATTTPQVCPSGMQPTLSSISQLLFQPNCTSCHTTATAQFTGGLDLTGDPYDRLVNVTAENTQAQPASRPAGLLRVKPGDPDNSLLYQKLVTGATPSPQYGEGMPLDRPGTVCQQTIDTVRSWIAAGAAHD